MPLKFTRHTISAEAFEAAAAFDVDGNGVMDIVSGGFWYEGPDFRRRHRICDVRRIGEYYDDFSTIPMDVNGNGRLDCVTGGIGGVLRWRENPGGKGEDWREHVIAECGAIETTRAWDVDGDGRLEIVPNTPGHALRVYKLLTDRNGKGAGQFSAHTIWDRAHGHGLGFGDINGDGRGEFVFCNGWLESPRNPLEGPWVFHQEFDLGCASVPILVVELDGRKALIAGNAHGYGLNWWEQGVNPDGERTWKRHPIDPFSSQFHDLHWADIDGDGANELITGKRFRAHCGSDPGEFDELGIYYYKWNGESFTKQIIAYGAEGSGCGIQCCLTDLRGCGRLDLIAPGKDGLQVFYNEGL